MANIAYINIFESFALEKKKRYTKYTPRNHFSISLYKNEHLLGQT